MLHDLWTSVWKGLGWERMRHARYVGGWLARHAYLKIHVLTEAELLVVLQLAGQRCAVGAAA